MCVCNGLSLYRFRLLRPTREFRHVRQIMNKITAAQHNTESSVGDFQWMSMCARRWHVRTTVFRVSANVCVWLRNHSNMCVDILDIWYITYIDILRVIQRSHAPPTVIMICCCVCRRHTFVSNVRQTHMYYTYSRRIVANMYRLYERSALRV